MGQLRLGTVRRARRPYSLCTFIVCMDALAPRAWLVLSILVSQFLELASKGLLLPASGPPSATLTPQSTISCYHLSQSLVSDNQETSTFMSWLTLDFPCGAPQGVAPLLGISIKPLFSGIIS